MNAKNNNRGRMRARAGISAVSTIALALGTAAVIPSGAAAQEGGNSEVVTDLQPGLAEKYGTVVNEVANATNNLPAGSNCQAKLIKEHDGTEGIAGLRYWALIPSSTAADKTKFGIDVHFDSSQGRTFNSWLVTDSKRGVPAKPDEVEAENPGPSELDSGNITHKATESASISGRTNVGFDIIGALDGEKIAQMATAEGVTYGWRSNYTEPNPNAKFFEGGNFEVSGFVNPWPGEYNDCSPITVNWKQIEKQVITPGDETTVGTINLKSDPGLRERLVVEAYDPQGKFLGTSDVAESGGKQMLSIAENGEIKFTWPEYVGTDLQAQQGARFAVFAKPRTEAELLKIAQGRTDYPDDVTVTKESIDALQRYNKPNLVGTHQISLDDTQFHDPDYINNQQSIISHVQSETGPVLDEKARQTVTFRPKPNPDNPEHDLAKLVAEKKATVTLDKRYVNNGWKAKLNDDYSVTVTSPVQKETDAGTFAMPKVIVTYSNGSEDILPLLVTVDPNDTQKTDLEAGGLVKGAPGSTMTSNLTRTPIYENRPASTPKEWKVEGDLKGWTVKVENDIVTAVAPADATDGTKITPKVTAVYPDGTTDTVTVEFSVEQNVKVPRYASESGKPGDSLTLTPTQPPTGLGGNADDEEPNRYTFPDDSLEYTVGDWKVTINPDTGALTTTVPESALPGAFITVPVKTHYASGSPAQQTSGTYVVIGDGTGTDVAHYPPRVTRAGQPVESKLNTQLKNPESATYTLPPEDEWPTGWKFTIDKAGNVTSTPPKDAAPNTLITIPVKVNYPDGSEGEVPAEVKVVGTDTEANDPQYPTERGKPGDEVTSTVDTSRMQPGKKTYSIITNPKAPGYIAPPARLGSWDNVKINSETGEILTPIPDNALPGSSADIPVRVDYEDGTIDITKATVVVEGERSQVYSPEYKQQVTKPGEEVGSKVLTDAKKEDLAKENAYSVPEKVGEWEVRVDENGQVFAKPPADAKSGDSIDVPVKVTYEDGSSKEVFAAFVVQTLDKDVHEPVYPVESTTPGKPVKRNVAPPALPKGSTFKIDQPNNDWEYEINPQTGEITVTPPDDAKPGDKDVQNVTVTYPDGSTEEVPVTTVVNLTNNYEAEPVYPAENVYPGEQAKSPLKVERPEGLTFAKENPYTITPQGDDATNWKPTGENNDFGNPIYTVNTTNGDWTVSLDKEGNVLSTAPATAKPGDLINVPVTVKYSDGSTDIAKAPIAVVDRPTRELPFDVVYEYDENLPAGTYKVAKEGEPGSEHQLKDRTWKKTKEPVNEVVKVGTKQAVANDKVEWTAPIPYDTILRENPALKPGEVKEVQAGELGEKRYTADFKGQEGNASTNVKLETVKQSTARIVEYGPGLDPQELVTTTKKPVPFEVKVIEDPDLPAGTFKTEQKGEAGEETETSTQKLVDGKPSGDPVVETKQTKAPKEEIIRVGTKPAESTKSESWKEPVPFDTEFKPNPALKPGEVKVTVEGTPGEKTVTVNTKTVGTETTIERTQNVDTPAVNRVVEYGPTPADTEVTDTVERDVPFETEVVEDPTLPTGTIVRETEGKPGKETVTTTQKIVAGKPEGTPTQTVNRTQEPVNGKVRVGTGKVSADAPYNIKYETDPNLEAGKYEVVTPGKPGKQEYQNDGTWKVTEAPTDEVVKIGTKQPTGAKDVTWTVPTMFETELRPNPALAAGEVKEVQPGKQGETTHTAKFAFDGTQATVMESTETKAPQKRIVEYGPSLGENTLVATTKKPVPFEVEVIEDPNLPAGTVKTDQTGEAGEEVETSTQKLLNGKPSGDAVVKSERTKEPVKHIIRVGTKPAETPDQPDTPAEPHTVEIPYPTEIEYDATKPAGEVTETQQGVNGSKTFQGTKLVKETAPTPRKVVIGTKQSEPGEITWTEDVPFGVEIVEDPTLEAGKTAIEQQGVAGQKRTSYKDGEQTSTTVKDPVTHIIRVGTKPAATELREKTITPLPFETIYRKVNTLQAGEIRVVEQGSYGEKETSKVWQLVDGKPVGDPLTNESTLKEPTNRIIEVGTGRIVPIYSKIVQEPGATNEVPLFENSQLPAGATYEIDPDWTPAVPGWTASVDENGKVTSTPPADAKPGDTVTIPVKITYLDGQSITVPAVATIKETEGAPKRTDYGVTTTIVGEKVELTPGNVREGDRFSVPKEVGGWQVSVDENGKVTATPPADAKPGDWIRIPVEVTGKDGNSYTTTAVVTVRGNTVEPEKPKPDTPTTPEVTPVYPPAITTPGAEETITVSSGHTDGNRYELGAVPAGWNATIDEATGALKVTPPADAKPGTKVDIPVKVTTADGKVLETKTVVGVVDKTVVPPADEGSSGAADFERCMANMFSLNSPILWLLPIGLAAAVGVPLAQHFQPQIDAAMGQINQALGSSNRDRGGHGGHGWERPEWLRQIDAQVAEINQRFAPVADQLQPIGIALGAIAAGALAISLIKQACEPEGFDYGMTIFGSSKEGEPNPASSKKGAIHDAIMGSSKQS